MLHCFNTFKKKIIDQWWYNYACMIDNVQCLQLYKVGMTVCRSRMFSNGHVKFHFQFRRLTD